MARQRFKCGLTRERLIDISGAVGSIGEGSVRRHGSRWQAVLDYQLEDGDEERRVQVTKGLSVACVGKSNRGRPEARAEMLAWRAQVVEDALSLTGSTEEATATVPAYVESYIAHKEEAGKVQPSTVASYRQSATYISHGLSRVTMEELDFRIVQNWVNGLNRKGYAPQTVKKSFQVLRNACKDAVRRGDIRSNPCYDVELPSRVASEPNALDAAGVARMNALLDIGADEDTPISERARRLAELMGPKADGSPRDAAEMERVVRAARPCPMTLGARLALNSGLRAEELCGLRWRCVDFHRGEGSAVTGATIRVLEVIGRTKGSTFVKQPKSKAGRRDIEVGPGPAAELSRRRSEMLADAKAKGITSKRFDSLHVLGDVLAGADGDGGRRGWMDPHWLGVQWGRLSRRAELFGTEGRPVTMHDLRHTYATQAIANGIYVRTLASVLGHADVSLTLNTYAAADPDAKRRVVAVMDGVMSARPIRADVIPLRDGTTGR